MLARTPNKHEIEHHETDGKKTALEKHINLPFFANCEKCSTYFAYETLRSRNQGHLKNSFLNQIRNNYKSNSFFNLVHVYILCFFLCNLKENV